MNESGDTLTSVAPRFTWTVPDAPGFARPFTFQLRVTRESGAGLTLLDTTLADTSVVLPVPLRGGVQISWFLAGASADSAAATVVSPATLTVPAGDIETLDNPAERHPRLPAEFRWASPRCPRRRGPFQYDLRHARGQRAGRGGGGQPATTSTCPSSTSDTPYRWR
jgi:hypothetical protein